MDYINKFLKYLSVVKKYSDYTIKSYEIDLLELYDFNTNLLHITNKEVREYLDFLYSKKLKRNTISRKLSSIRSFYNYLINEDISLENEELRKEIIKIIITATSKKHRVYHDVVNNPDLAISLIDKAVAFAKVYDSEVLTIDHLIESLECCDRIYETAKEDAILLLKNLKIKKENPDTNNKILVYDFTRK